MTETDTGLSQESKKKSPEEIAANEFEELISMMLDLSAEKYDVPWAPIEFQKMREILTAGRGKFPKKVIPYVMLMRKFLFANAKLIALSAMAHQTAQAKSKEKETLVKPATFADLGELEAERIRGRKNG